MIIDFRVRPPFKSNLNLAIFGHAWDKRGGAEVWTGSGVPLAEGWTELPEGALFPPPAQPARAKIPANKIPSTRFFMICSLL